MGQNRVVIEQVAPQVNCGQFPIKRTPGESVSITADIYADGHDKLFAEFLWKNKKEKTWNRNRMLSGPNDTWTAEFIPDEPGVYVFTVVAGIDYLSTWHADLVKKIDAAQEVADHLQAGARLLRGLVARASKNDRKRIEKLLEKIETEQGVEQLKTPSAVQFISSLLPKYHEERFVTKYHKELEVEVSRIKARFSAWYELFPRSVSGYKGEHGTFEDCQKLLPKIAEMGFDVLYFPPIHPIGKTHRKGKNNQTRSEKGDPGSPWAIGSTEGGHDAIHSELGTLEDYQALLIAAKEFDIEIAFDLAFQCSPDHPYIKDHPEWFLWQPDGTVRYAENPPWKMTN